MANKTHSRPNLLLTTCYLLTRRLWISLPSLPLVLASKVSAASDYSLDINPSVPFAGSDIVDIVKYGVDVAIIVGGVVYVLLLLVGGIQYLTAAGNEDATKKAIRTLMNATIGLVIIVLAWAVSTYVACTLLQINGLLC